jgi:hypothetical protein
MNKIAIAALAAVNANAWNWDELLADAGSELDA